MTIRTIFRSACVVAFGLVLLSPVAFAVRVSFSPNSFLTYTSDEWSLRWYRAFLADPRWLDALVRSLIVAILSAAVAVATAAPFAMAVVRFRFTGRRLMETAAILPACLPVVVLGIGLLPAFYALGLWGSPAGLILSHALLGFPAVYLIARMHFEEVGEDLEAVARGLGATARQATWRITLPLIRPALLTGAVIAYVGSFNESMLAIFLTTPETETLPALVWPQLRYAATPLVAVASCLGAVAAGLGSFPFFRIIRR